MYRSRCSTAGLPINTEGEWPLWIAWQSFLAVLEFGNLYAIKIGLILLAAFVLPRVFLWPFRRSVAGEGSGLVLSALRTFLKFGGWVTAFALVNPLPSPQASTSSVARAPKT